ncbi:MAG: transposase, partial [Candidatus Tectomicrobia bacterium]|nr:transposase [Candidatus Tectomicrobia bacterium]
FGEFRRQAEYKTTWAGEQLMIADRFFASSRLCSVCGCKNFELTLADRVWICPGCSSLHDRDENASINLKNLATGSFSGSHAHGQNVRPGLPGDSGRNENQAQNLLC